MKTLAQALGILVLIALLLGLVFTTGPRDYNGERFGGPVSRAKVQMNIFEQSIERYYLRHRVLPERIDQLAEPHEGEAIMDAIPTDPWGNPFRYLRIDDTTFVILCRGEDGVAGTPDDLRSPQPEEPWR